MLRGFFVLCFSLCGSGVSIPHLIGLGCKYRYCARYNTYYTEGLLLLSQSSRGIALKVKFENLNWVKHDSI